MRFREKGGSLTKGNLHPSITFIKFWRAIHEELNFVRLRAFTLIIRPSASFCGVTSIKVRDMTECAYPYGWMDGWTINFINYDESHNSCLVASWLLQLLAGSCSIFFFPSPRPASPQTPRCHCSAKCCCRGKLKTIRKSFSIRIWQSSR